MNRLYDNMITYKCLAGNTPVYAKSQGKPLRTNIKDLSRYPLDQLCIAGKDSWRKIKSIEKQVPTELLTIHLRNGMRIESTPEHCFPTQSGLRMASKLNKGDKLLHTKLPCEEGTPLGLGLVGEAVGLYLAEGSVCKKGLQFSLCAGENELYETLKSFAEKFAATCRKHVYNNNLTVVINGAAAVGVIKNYVAGEGAKSKHLSRAAFCENNEFLGGILSGYLKGDGHYDKANDRWRIGFTLNRSLEYDLRTVCNRLGYYMRAKLTKAKCGGKTYPAIRGEIRKRRTGHFNQKDDYEVLRIFPTKGISYEIEVDGDHIFVLADGTLIHDNKTMP